ncbi:SCO family protein [Tenacibaculum maritimum]|uniref:SCO family protein n=1 Tax=Tenacibaculum maritimum TaxID=107401 RepID=UPI0012E6D372|nr:SCO family protein [Tenacibaculum maritimum]MDB0601043.1 SCO family protein [Tenacibaculum maritimum]MDB0611845.1 SCO family protein [Tenacibaculum maritimum]CAA0193587.1 Probable cytochrome c oxidase biogenesis protein [Tenacibaculum maritimum]
MNLQFFKKSKYTLIFIIVFSAIAIPVFYHLLKVDKKLRIYNPVDFNPRLVDTSVKHVKKNHTIADFKLVNQNGKIITNKNYDGKIYIADFFFTRCPSICVLMADNMMKLQEYYKNDEDIMFLSHSVTPVIDSVSVLRAYANRKGVIDGKWNVTTGSKKHIYALARKSYFAVLDEGEGDEDDFIHTENFVLIDKERRIRGSYDGTDEKNIQKIIDDIQMLKEEYSRR